MASFFVSRIDTEADRRLDQIGGHDELKGKLAIANAGPPTPHYLEASPGPAGSTSRARARPRARAVGVDLDEEPGLSGHAVRR